MTKAEKAEVRAKYERGEGTYINAEAEIKAAEKHERQAIRRQEKRIKKMAKQALVEEQVKIAKLEQKIAELEAENAHLRSLKDLSSDIPEDKLIEYEELDKLFPDGIPEDFDWNRFSPSCRAKLEEDCKKCDEKIGAHLKSLDLEQQEQNVRAMLASRAEEESDIPTEEELLESKKKTLSFRLQEFHKKGYLQKSEAERLRLNSIYCNDIEPIRDESVSLEEALKHAEARMKIASYIFSNKSEFSVENGKENENRVWIWARNVLNTCRNK